MSGLNNHRREAVLAGLWHDYANLFPMLDANAQDALRADIKAHGVREPIIIFAGRILDGRNRYMAARDLGLDFPVADFEGTDAEALAFVLSTNLHRRHLTESQRSAVAAKLANMGRGNPDFSKGANLPNSGVEATAPVSVADAAAMLNVSERSVKAARKVQNEGAPELNAAVESGAVAVSAAASVAELPKEEQAAVVAEGPKAVKAKAKEIREAKSIPVDLPPVDDGEEEPIPADVAAVMRKHAGLTREALLRDYAELVVEAKAERAKAKDEIADLKAKLAELTDDDKDSVIRSLQAKVKNADSAKWRATEEQRVAMKQVYALKKRVAELEGMEVGL